MLREKSEKSEKSVAVTRFERTTDHCSRDYKNFQRLGKELERRPKRIEKRSQIVTGNAAEFKQIYDGTPTRLTARRPELSNLAYRRTLASGCIWRPSAFAKTFGKLCVCFSPFFRGEE
jgi:hypothetical protein